MDTHDLDLPHPPGFHVVYNLGVVRGVTVRARWIGSQVTAAIRTLGGGKIYEYIELCEQTRAEAFEYMLQHADAWAPTRSWACGTMRPISATT